MDGAYILNVLLWKWSLKGTCGDTFESLEVDEGGQKPTLEAFNKACAEYDVFKSNMDAIKSIESEITPRRLREAHLEALGYSGFDGAGAWLHEKEQQILAKRANL